MMENITAATRFIIGIVIITISTIIITVHLLREQSENNSGREFFMVKFFQDQIHVVILNILARINHIITFHMEITMDLAENNFLDNY